MGPEVLAGVLQRQNHFHNNAVMLFDLNFCTLSSVQNLIPLI